MAHRKWKEIKQQPGTAGPGNMLGCCLISFHFLGAIRPVQCLVFKHFLFGAVSKFNLSWLKDGRPVHKMPRVHATKFSPETSSSDKDGKAVMAEAELFVNNVQKEDSGAYQCVVGVAGEGGNGVSETQASAELRLGGKKRNGAGFSVERRAFVF